MTDGDSGLTTGAADCRDEDKDEGMDRPLRCVSSLLYTSSPATRQNPQTQTRVDPSTSMNLC
jgi:hypothetical protein